MELLQVKLLAVILLGIASLICGLLPLKMRRYILTRDPSHPSGRRRELVVSFLLCFGAGVLFAAVMIHMLPEVREGFVRAKVLQEKQDNLHHSEFHEDHSGHSHVDHGHNDQMHNNDLHLKHTSSLSPGQADTSAKDNHLPHSRHDHFHDHQLHSEHPHHDKPDLHDHSHHDHDASESDNHHSHSLFKDDDVHDHVEHHGHPNSSNSEDHHAHKSVTHDHLIIPDSDYPENQLAVTDTPSEDHPDHDNYVTEEFDLITTEEPLSTTSETRVKRDVPPAEVVSSLHRQGKEIGHDHDSPRELHSSETEEQHAHEEAHNHEAHEYPLSELVVCAGFFIVYFIEELVHWAFSLNNTHGHNHAGHSHFAGLEGRKSTQTNGSIAKESTYKKGLGRRAAWRPAQLNGIDNPIFMASEQDVSPQNKDPQMQEESGGSYSSMNLAVAEEASETKERPSCGQIMMENIRSLLMVVALSLHSVFEGLAVGLQENVRDTWYLTLAVAAHKLVIQFCVGMELIVIGASLKAVILYIVVMSLTNPIGASLGMFLTRDGAFFADPQQLFLITVLQGFAAGTILYVTFFEILERERNKTGGRFVKFIALVLGFAFLAVIENFGAHSHGPSEEHAH